MSSSNTTSETVKNKSNSLREVTINHAHKPTACEECRRVHKACDKQRPCARCIKQGCECKDIAPVKRGRPRKDVTQKKLSVQSTSFEETTMKSIGGLTRKYSLRKKPQRSQRILMMEEEEMDSPDTPSSATSTDLDEESIYSTTSTKRKRETTNDRVESPLLPPEYSPKKQKKEEEEIVMQPEMPKYPLNPTSHVHRSTPETPIEEHKPLNLYYYSNFVQASPQTPTVKVKYQSPYSPVTPLTPLTPLTPMQYSPISNHQRSPPASPLTNYQSYHMTYHNTREHQQYRQQVEVRHQYQQHPPPQNQQVYVYPVTHNPPSTSAIYSVHNSNYSQQSQLPPPMYFPNTMTSSNVVKQEDSCKSWSRDSNLPSIRSLGILPSQRHQGGAVFQGL